MDVPAGGRARGGAADRSAPRVEDISPQDMTAVAIDVSQLLQVASNLPREAAEA